MNLLGMAAMAVREGFGPSSLPREPEPAVMDEPEQAGDYVQGTIVGDAMAGNYLFHAAHIAQVLRARDCRTVLDLGCGPAVQLGQVAGLLPEIRFLGCDLSPSMLATARGHLAAQRLGNVTVQEEDMTRLAGVADHAVDGVISTLALHHLPSEDHLRAVLRAITRVLKPGGAVYLTDFCRLKSLRSVLGLAYTDRKLPHRFALDYERSLRAAFGRDDLVRLIAEELPVGARLFTTAVVPVLGICSTPGIPLDAGLRATLARQRAALGAGARRDLGQMRRFFHIGGLGPDPFA